MILSAEATFSDAQALTATARSTNVIDLGSPGTVLNAPAALVRDIGKGTPIPVRVQLDVAAGGTSPTLVVALEMDTVANFASATVLMTSGTKAGGAAGDRIDTLYILPHEITEQFISLNYTLGGTTPTYTVTSFIPLADHSSDGVAGV